MAQNVLVNSKIDVGIRFLREFQKYVPISVAFWLKAEELGSWKFYVASDQFSSGNYDAAYDEVLRIAERMKDVDFDPFQVRLIGIEDPMVKDALRLYERRPPKPFEVENVSFGGTTVARVLLIQGSAGGYPMTGQETLSNIIDEVTNFVQQHGKQPEKIKLPMLMAYNLAKCTRDELGELSTQIVRGGIGILATEGLYGMKVEIVPDNKAKLELE